MKDLDCCVVRDLLPLYVEKLSAPETGEEIEAHLARCEECRAFCRACLKELPLSIEKPSGGDKKIIRRMHFQLLWYLFWPALYLLSVLFSVPQITGLMMVMAMAVLGVMLSHNTMYIYDLDDTKKGFYNQEAKNLRQGNGSFFMKGVIWLLPILLPLILGAIPGLINYVRGMIH